MRPVAEADRARARLHLLDWIGCAAAGRREPAGEALASAREAGESGAAFVWGGLGNILEMDDVDKRGLLHPGPAIIPAVLSMAGEAEGHSVLDALVCGYEATIRLGRAVGPGHYAMWHNTGTCGAIGAAAGSARLMGLDAGQLAQALALGVSQAAGLWQTRHEPASMGKQLHTAHAARAGRDAARLAAAGFAGPLSILEGAQGFFAAMCPGAQAEAVLTGSGGDWAIHEVSFKPWPACRHAHAAIDAALAARSQIDVNAIEAVRLETYGDALTFCDRPDPDTPIEAKFSLQHCVAVTLLDGPPGLGAFAEDMIARKDVGALRDKVRVDAQDGYEAAYPGRFGAALTVQTVGGEYRIEVPDALGDPENPIPEDQLEHKFRMLMDAAGCGGGLQERVITVLADLTAGRPAAPLVRLVGEVLA